MTEATVEAHSRVDAVKPRDDVSAEEEKQSTEIMLQYQAPQPRTSKQRLDEAAVQILRAHHLQRILDILTKIQPHAQTSAVARFAGELISTINTYIDDLEDDPAVEVMVTLYPALVDNNRWATFTQQHFVTLREIIASLGTSRNVDENIVEKAIIRIEDDLGIDSLPFECDPSSID